jgi:hypothetical protein
MEQRGSVGEAAKRIFHRCERHGHGEDLLHVCFRKQ